MQAIYNWVLSKTAARGMILAGGLCLAATAFGQDDHDHAGHAHAAETEAPSAKAVANDHAGHDHAAGAEAPSAKAAANEHAGHDHAETNAPHDEHAEEAEEGGLRLTAEQRTRFGLVVRAAGPGSLRNEVRLPGEIVFNEDRVVHLVPRVAGIVRTVSKSIGDSVAAGEVLAVIDSRELADAKSEFLAASARCALAEKNFTREKTLREKQISPEQDYLEAEQALSEARIALRSSEQKLHALGFNENEVGALDAVQDASITRYEIRSPLAGVVIEKHISLGESLAADADIFTVADLSSVWVNLTVYTRDLGSVQAGQEVVLRMEHSGAQARGAIAMVAPFVDVSTRSATARVILDNPDGQWMPGTFVSGFIAMSAKELPVVVPRQAVQYIDGRDVVFIEHEGSFEMAAVATGRSDREHIEVVSGLEPGTPYAAEGAFQLKAAIVTSAMGSHAGHGH